jgi:hypothetical protein
MYKIKAQEMMSLVKSYYRGNASLMVYGAFGIGKSHITKQVAKDLAKEEGREFVDWNTLTITERNALFGKEEKYFLFVDVRLSQNDISDLKGLPKFDDTGDSVNWKVPKWISYLSSPKTTGLIFFDEINLAHPSVLASAYQILHDRCANETALTPKLGIVGAGNRAQDKSFSFEMPDPLKDRLGEVELEFNLDAWFEWAFANNINPNLLSFLKFKPSYVCKIDKEGVAKAITPRGHETTSRLLDNKDKSSDDYMIVASRLGEGFATEFEAFVKINREIDLKHILDNPKEMEKYTKMDMVYSIMGGIAEMYRSKKEVFDKCIDVAGVVKPEFCVLLLQLMKGAQPTTFKNAVLKNNKAIKLCECNFKYFYG